MNRIFPVAVLTTILLQTSLAQTTFKISSYNETPEAFKYLLLTNAEIAANDTINEMILDLVEPMLLDSVIEKRKQFHRVFLVGPFIHAFGGYNWRAVDMVKQKFVGTVKNHGRSGSFEYTEWDIKFHLQFNLPEYFAKICKSCDYQKKLHRQDIRRSHRTDYTKEPFVRTSRNLNPLLYDLGAELTPPPAFIPQLNYLFFPTLPGAGGLKAHPNFQTEHPSIGFYGVSCLDCNHNCHPELHPYEWVWWLKATEDDDADDKTWLVGLFHEGSNRFKNWSVNPMTGQIKIPFVFRLDHAAPNIVIDHLVFNKFKTDELHKLDVPDSLIDTRQNHDIFITSDDKIRTTIGVQFNNILITDGLKYWFSDLNLDVPNHIISGFFHLATSVEDLYTTRITFTRKFYESEPDE